MVFCIYSSYELTIFLPKLFFKHRKFFYEFMLQKKNAAFALKRIEEEIQRKSKKRVFVANNAVADTVFKWKKAKRLAYSVGAKDVDLVACFFLCMVCKTTLFCYPVAYHQDNFPQKSIIDLLEESEECTDGTFDYVFSPKTEKKIDKTIAELRFEPTWDKLNKRLNNPIKRMAQLENKKIFQLPYPERAGCKGVGRGGSDKTKYYFAVVDWGGSSFGYLLRLITASQPER